MTFCPSKVNIEATPKSPIYWFSIAFRPNPYRETIENQHIKVHF